MLMKQIRTWDFVSPEVINIMQQLQREEFVPVTPVAVPSPKVSSAEVTVQERVEVTVES